MSKHKCCSPEYRRELVKLVRRSQSSCPQMALEVGVRPTQLSRWDWKAAAVWGQPVPGGGVARDEDLARLKRELPKASREQQPLGHAGAYFAKQPPNGPR
jgi:transposase